MPSIVKRALLCVGLCACHRTTTITDAGADAALPSAVIVTPPRDAGAPTPSARAQALRDLDAGRRLSRAKEWSAALAAFDRALAVMPDDARVLSEVGWAAFQANELTRAEAANARALANANEPLVRAPILYNAGRVAEARGRPDAARKAYRESLALRDNAEVKKRLAGLPVDAGPDEDDDAVARLGCRGSFADIRALCKCFEAAQTKDDALMVPSFAKFTCGRVASKSLGDGRLGVVDVGSGPEEPGERQHLLVMREGTKTRWLAVLGTDYEPGAFGVHNSAGAKDGEARTVNGHAVAVVRSVQDDFDSNMAGLEACTFKANYETVCALSDVPGETKCTPRIPLEAASACGPNPDLNPKELDENARAALDDLKKTATASSVRTSWKLSDDGKVNVTVLEGKRDLVGPAALNPAPLWK